MRVLLDECVDSRLVRDIAGHEVRAAHQMGWSGIKNGQLLSLAAKEFEVLVTVDRNLSFQQDVVSFEIAVIVLCATSNRLLDLQPLIPKLLEAIPTAKRGVATFIGA